ncbi:hypothetical protein V5N11_009993 [Cardamine amara subsp. amara]|uniref:Transposase MuDR plant domain-containing protein n=1 Tax=Cardamine amara subsp. amara TaxID=228776 RepID=A0ABD1B5S6_CARAN
MEEIIIVCGKWRFEKCRWLFVVDAKRGSRILEADDSLNYENFIGMVFEDYGLDNRVYDVELSYMFPKKIMQKLPQDTPLVYVENYRQFKTFLGQSKADMLRLCVEVKDKMDIKKTLHVEVPKAEENDEDGNDDDESRFDYCDDSDETDSGDENFSAYRMMPEEEEEEEEKPILPIKKIASTFYVSEGNANAEFVKFQLSSLDLAVRQCYESKEELETRMKILTVVQKFDFDVDKSTPELLTVKCLVDGCSWRVRATPIVDYPRFHVRQYIPNHTCSVTERSARSRQATHEILGLLYKDFVCGVGPTVFPMHVADALNK